HQVLLPREKCPVAHAAAVDRLNPLPVEAPKEVGHDRVRNDAPLARIHEAEEDEVTQEHPPASSEAPEQATPVQILTARQDQMGDVRAVVALALHDEAL